MVIMVAAGIISHSCLRKQSPSVDILEDAIPQLGCPSSIDGHRFYQQFLPLVPGTRGGVEPDLVLTWRLSQILV